MQSNNFEMGLIKYEATKTHKTIYRVNMSSCNKQKLLYQKLLFETF